MAAIVKSTQVYDDAKAASLDTILAALSILPVDNFSGARSITLPGGVVVKWGNVGVDGTSIPANIAATKSYTFNTGFPTACLVFIPVVSFQTNNSDVYGVITVTSITPLDVQYTVKNGPTAQGLAGMQFIAIGY